jgi:hypothetical protein
MMQLFRILSTIIIIIAGSVLTLGLFILTIVGLLVASLKELAAYISTRQGIKAASMPSFKVTHVNVFATQQE